MQVGRIEAPPAYQRIAPRALVLHQLRLSDSAVGRDLGVTDKSVRTRFPHIWEGWLWPKRLAAPPGRPRN